MTELAGPATATAVPRVLMVTGAYYPELSGGGLQCRELARALGDCVSLRILTTSADPTVRATDHVDGIPVHRIGVDVRRILSLVHATWSMMTWFVRFRNRFEIVHLHGFSRKSWLIVILSRLFRKKILLKITSAGNDDPLTVRARDRIGYYFYSQADSFWGVSPAIERMYFQSGLPAASFKLIPNGVDLQRFRAARIGEREALRRELSLPDQLRLVLFVGFFSTEKHPERLFDAWKSLPPPLLDTTGLVFIGSTRSNYYEVNRPLAERIKATASLLSRNGQVIFVERTLNIEKYYRAADLFVLPSEREGLPNALLEAMATGLPCVATRLAGVTDVLICDGFNGLLVARDDQASLSSAIERLLRDPAAAAVLGMRARATVEERYSIESSAIEAASLYRHLLNGLSS